MIKTRLAKDLTITYLQAYVFFLLNNFYYLGFLQTNVTTKPLSESPENEIPNPYTSTPSACTLCHVGYVAGSVPLRTVTSKCRVCRYLKLINPTFEFNC